MNVSIDTLRRGVISISLIIIFVVLLSFTNKPQEPVELIEPEPPSIKYESIELKDVQKKFNVINNVNTNIKNRSIDYISPPVSKKGSKKIVTALNLTDEEIDLIALVTMAEAEGESELGQRLVIDVILNRRDHPSFPDTIHGVIYQENQFACMTSGRSDRCYVKDDIRQLVLEEMQVRTDTKVLYFRTEHYHTFGVPLFKEGNHYFSTD